MKLNLEKLDEIISHTKQIAIAVSGGIDSLTLASYVNKKKRNIEIFHAVSPAVDFVATERVKKISDDQNWKLTIVNAEEFKDNNYISNPKNRCFYCKINLYSKISSLTKAQIFSGTNIDDLKEYRPGLQAAKQNNVVHPFVDAAINKSQIRVLAKKMGLREIADLPASPCLSSRVETGINIDPEILKLINSSEKLISKITGFKVVRCRLRRDFIVIELEKINLYKLKEKTQIELVKKIKNIFQRKVKNKNVIFDLYRTGNAFNLNYVKR